MSCSCPQCGNEMIISRLDGYIWFCIFCGHIGPLATDEEYYTWEIQQKISWERVLNG